MMVNTFKPDWTTAQLMTELEAENKRLREALDNLIDATNCYCYDGIECYVCEAQQALKENE